MPFTPSHAVVALPFVRTPLVPAAIAIGAMTPDLPLFVRVLLPRYAVTHDFAMAAAHDGDRARAAARLAVRAATGDPRAGAAVAGGATSRRLGRGVAHGRQGDLPVVARHPAARSRRSRSASPRTSSGTSSRTRVDGGFRRIPALAEPWGPFSGLQVAAARFERRGARRSSPSGVRSGWRDEPGQPSPGAVCRAGSGGRGGHRCRVLLVVALAWGLAATGPLTDEWTPAHLGYLVLPPACAAWGAADRRPGASPSSWSGRYAAPRAGSPSPPPADRRRV